MATKADEIIEVPVEVVDETPETIAMDEVDVRTGVLFEIEAARAQARLQAITDAANLFAEQMKSKYKVDSKTHQMTDWITGFKRVEKKE